MDELLSTAAPEFQSLGRIRADLEALVAQANAIHKAPLAPEEVRDRVLSGLRGAIYQYTPENRFTGIQHGNGDEALLGATGFGLPDLAWIFGPKELTDLVMKRLAESGAKPGLPAAERAARLAELQEARERLERAEEEEVLKLESNRFLVLRRIDANPAILRKVWREHGQREAA